MKKYLGAIALSILLLVSCSAMLACKKEKAQPEYFSLKLEQSVGGTLTATLKEGSVKDGHYLSGSMITIEAAASNENGFVYGFVRIRINGNDIDTPSHTFKITANTTVRADFRRLPQAANTLSRIEEAFLNTYDLADYADADGIRGTINQQLTDQNNFSYNISTSFSFAKNSADSFFATEIRMGVIPLLSIYYMDSLVEGEAKLYFDILGLQDYYYINTYTVAEIFEIMNREVDGEPDSGIGDNSDFFSIDLLELLGVVYNIENKPAHSSFSVDLTFLFDLISEFIEYETQSSAIKEFLAMLPQLTLSLRFDYKADLDTEQIKDISYTIVSSDINNDEQTSEVMDFTVNSKVKIELSLWNGTPPTAPVNPDNATLSTVTEIIEMLQSLMDLIQSIA